MRRTHADQQKLDGEQPVPLRWVGATLLLAGGALGTALSVGIWSARISSSQEGTERRVTSIEDSRAASASDNRKFQNEVLQRLTAIETKVDSLKK